MNKNTTDKNFARHLIVVGGYGVVGNGVVDAISPLSNWRVTTVARREAPHKLLNGKIAPPHVQVDLLDLASTKKAFSSLTTVTDIVFCAYTERETMAATIAPNVTMLSNTITTLKEVGANLNHVVLIGGGKSYGEHLGPYKTPAKERDARFLGPIFYNDQEDLLWEQAERDGFSWTVLRPDGVIGPSIGSPMNMLTGLASFASISRELCVPLRFPGSLGAWSALHQMTDAGVLSEAALWSLTTKTARNEIFNVTNGDNFRWQHLWSEIAEFFDMPTATPQPMLLSEQMSDKASIWERIVKKNKLQATPWTEIAAWPFLDGWLNTDFDMVQSTIKIRRAGFTGCIDTHESIVQHLGHLREYRLIP